MAMLEQYHSKGVNWENILNVTGEDRVVESQHEDLRNDVASNDQGLQTERNGEPSQGLMMVV